jgi:hypothetical protein
MKVEALKLKSKAKIMKKKAVSIALEAHMLQALPKN